MTSLLVSIPILGRPERANRVATSCRSSVSRDVNLRIRFSCSPGDDAAIRACERTGEEVVVVEWPQPCRADWARKNNAAYATMTEEWILLGADDLRFHAGWFDACLRAADRHPGGACVVGTNDLGNARVLQGIHSTHPLVHRDYLACGGVIDDPGLLLPEAYGHWFVDDEFVGTARVRGCYAHAHDAVVEHLHPAWGKAPDDATYQQGQASILQDRDLFQARRPLWDPRTPRRQPRG